MRVTLMVRPSEMDEAENILEQIDICPSFYDLRAGATNLSPEEARALDRLVEIEAEIEAEIEVEAVALRKERESARDHGQLMVINGSR